MRVFRKRQLRLREEDGKVTTLTGDSNRIPETLSGASEAASAAHKTLNVRFNSGSSNNNEVNYSPNTNPSITGATEAGQNAFNHNYGFSVKIGPDGKIMKKESKLSRNLIEGAVMFSKKELRDFLKRI